MAALRFLPLLSLLVFANVVLSLDPNCKTAERGACFFRPYLNVYKFSSPDYPAMFFLTGGIVLVLVIAVTFIAVGLLTMDPGKDSIIYRMTTTRMKKD
ncbi:hypothetical protein FO519_006529 [Halicephalobus sp. NKZ332]|nr:hypothetical protein FO519_006529 [Halicephalobus sp. NKZ332]